MKVNATKSQLQIINPVNINKLHFNYSRNRYLYEKASYVVVK